MSGQTTRWHDRHRTGQAGRTGTRGARSIGPAPRLRWQLTTALLSLAGLALLAGCSGDATDDAATADGGTVDSGEADGEWIDGLTDEAETAEDASDTGGDLPPATVDDGGDAVRTVGARSGRRIVRTARLELEVEDAAGAADEVAAIATRVGGFVGETDLERDQEGVVRGSITLRVPSAELFATVEELDALAVAVPIRRIDEQDVTAESTDLEARLTNLTAYELELRALLADVRETTTRPDDLLTIFERIRSVRAEIDQAEARLAVLDDQVALSTVHVVLRPAASAVPVADPTWAPAETVRDALTTTSRALSSIADAAIRFTLTVLPIGLLLGSPLLVGTVVWRRYRVRRPTGPKGPGQAEPQTPAAT